MRRDTIGLGRRGLCREVDRLAAAVLRLGAGDRQAERGGQGLAVAAAALGRGADDLVAQRLSPAEPRLRVLAGDERGVHPDRDDPSDASPLGTSASGKLSSLTTYRARSQPLTSSGPANPPGPSPHRDGARHSGLAPRSIARRSGRGPRTTITLRTAAVARPPSARTARSRRKPD